MLNYFKYISVTNVPKKMRQKKIVLCQNEFIFKNIFELYQVTRYSQKIASVKML